MKKTLALLAVIGLASASDFYGEWFDAMRTMNKPPGQSYLDFQLDAARKVLERKGTKEAGIRAELSSLKRLLERTGHLDNDELFANEVDDDFFVDNSKDTAATQKPKRDVSAYLKQLKQGTGYSVVEHYHPTYGSAWDDEFVASDDVDRIFKAHERSKQTGKSLDEQFLEDTRKSMEKKGYKEGQIQAELSYWRREFDKPVYLYDDELVAARPKNHTETAKPHKNSTLGHLGSLLKDAKKNVMLDKDSLKNTTTTATAKPIHQKTKELVKNATKAAVPKKEFLSMF